MTTLDGIADATPNSPTPLFPCSPSPEMQEFIHPQVEGAIREAAAHPAAPSFPAMNEKTQR